MHTLRTLIVTAFACTSLTLTVGCGDIEWDTDALAGGGAYQAADDIAAGPDGSGDEGGFICADGRADTPALADAAVTGPWGPMSRVTRMGVPQDPADAVALGCEMIGHNNGSGLATFLAETDLDINELLTPDADGRAQLVLLAALEGWAAGETGNGAGRTDLNLVMGQQDADGNLYIDPVSLGDNGEALDRFADARTECGALDTDPADLVARLPILGDLNVAVTSAALSADLSLDASGFAMHNGRLQGYLTRETLADVLYFVLDMCANGSDEVLCEQVAGLPATEAMAGAMTPVFVSQYLNGFDAVVGADGTVSADCNPGVDCNAVSVCLTVESAGQTVVGVGR